MFPASSPSLRLRTEDIDEDRLLAVDSNGVCSVGSGSGLIFRFCNFMRAVLATSTTKARPNIPNEVPIIPVRTKGSRLLLILRILILVMTYHSGVIEAIENEVGELATEPEAVLHDFSTSERSPMLASEFNSEFSPHFEQIFFPPNCV